MNQADIDRILNHAHLKIDACDLFEPIVADPRFEVWFKKYEHDLIEAMLSCPMADHEQRYALQIAVRAARSWKAWIVASAAGRKSAEKSILDVEKHMERRPHA